MAILASTHAFVFKVTAALQDLGDDRRPRGDVPRLRYRIDRVEVSHDPDAQSMCAEARSAK